MRQVLVIHGWSDDSGSFKPLGTKLRSAGFDALDVWLANYVSMDDDVTVTDAAKRMEEVVGALVAAGTISVPFDMVVHSTGGLVARNWLVLFDCAQGALAQAAGHAGARQLRLGAGRQGQVLHRPGHQGHQQRLFDRHANAQRARARLAVPVGTRAFRRAEHRGCGRDRRQASLWRGCLHAVRAVGHSRLRRHPDEDRQRGRRRRHGACRRRQPERLRCHARLLGRRRQPHVHRLDAARRAGALCLPRLDRREPLEHRAHRGRRDLRPDRRSAAVQGRRRLSRHPARMGGSHRCAGSGRRFGPASLLHAQHFRRRRPGQPGRRSLHRVLRPRSRVEQRADALLSRQGDPRRAPEPGAKACRCFYLDRTALMGGFYERIAGNAKKELLLSITAAPPGSNTRYFRSTGAGADGSFRLHLFDDTNPEERWLKRYSTHFLKIIIPRRPNANVFRLTQLPA